MVGGNGEDRSPHISFILKGSQILAFQSKGSNPRHRSKNIETKYKTHIKHVHEEYGTCYEYNVNKLRVNHLATLLVVTMPYTYWFLWRVVYIEIFKWWCLHFAIWNCIFKGCLERGIVWRAKSRLKGIEDLNPEHWWEGSHGLDRGEKGHFGKGKERKGEQEQVWREQSPREAAGALRQPHDQWQWQPLAHWQPASQSTPYRLTDQCSRLKPSFEFHFEGLSNFNSSVERLVQIQDVNPRIQKWNTKLVLNLCINYMVHVSSTTWRIKNQPSNPTSRSDDALRLLVIVAGKFFWGLQVTSSFSIWAGGHCNPNHVHPTLVTLIIIKLQMISEVPK